MGHGLPGEMGAAARAIVVQGDEIKRLAAQNAKLLEALHNHAEVMLDSTRVGWSAANYELLLSELADSARAVIEEVEKS